MEHVSPNTAPTDLDFRNRAGTSTVASAAQQFTDGSLSGGYNKPGFRIPLHGDTKQRAVLDAAYQLYERELTNRWRQNDHERPCDQCDGTGISGIGGEDCEVCDGRGYIPAASDRSADAAATHIEAVRPPRATDAISKHRQVMDRLYSDYDKSISEQWRQR